MNPFTGPHMRWYIGDLSPSRRESVQRCRDVEPLIELAHSKNLYKTYPSSHRNLMSFYAYCTGSMTYAQLADSAEVSVSTISAGINRIIYQTMYHEADIYMDRVKKESIFI